MVLTRRLLIVALGLSIVVVALPAPATVWLCLAAVVLLAAADMLLAGSPRTVRVERVPTDAVRLDQRTTAETVLHHTGRRRLTGSAKDGWQPSAGAVRQIAEVRLAPGGSHTLRTVLVPRRRGDLRSETVAVRSLGPLGMAGRQVTHRVPHLQRVLPPFRARRHLPSKRHRLRELDGQTAVQIRGAGTEFDSLRDYVRGDDVRSIDWRATARRQHLVVRTWRPERDRRVVLCLDSSRTSAARIEDEPRLDTGMEAALLLGVLAAGAGDRVDLLGFDRRLVARARSTTGTDFLHSMVTAMAPITPELVEADFSRLPGYVESVTSQRSLVVILTSLDSASFEEGLLPTLPTLTRRHLVLIASVRDPELDRRTLARETVGEVYRAAAAERSLIERRALRAQLTSLGVEVVEAPPHELPPELADAYIRLKAAGRL
ncbi:MAG: DUF58 domain-containing protein [Nesterenkonia sp.]|nr:DUF58 domain-containing protein [Nesterenkonia sp.]